MHPPPKKKNALSLWLSAPPCLSVETFILSPASFPDASFSTSYLIFHFRTVAGSLDSAYNVETRQATPHNSTTVRYNFKAVLKLFVNWEKERNAEWEVWYIHMRVCVCFCFFILNVGEHHRICAAAKTWRAGRRSWSQTSHRSWSHQSMWACFACSCLLIKFEQLNTSVLTELQSYYLTCCGHCVIQFYLGKNPPEESVKMLTDEVSQIQEVSVWTSQSWKAIGGKQSVFL